ncbi:Putative actin patch assembly and actin polymerization protein [Imshaugia aleurites]|uniref:Ubiquitin-like modifier HUB1 n=1 Tax=Imshaugia aleurites TaxID=172621 RepID=A0A8H3ILW3_9LECA|nr:Putative actin patch assembly and actin polymerization protein [Imshaugia aleurites]
MTSPTPTNQSNPTSPSDPSKPVKPASNPTLAPTNPNHHSPHPQPNSSNPTHQSKPITASKISKISENPPPKQTKTPTSKPHPPPFPPSATLIQVLITNRLGTRANIACLPSDTIGDFKKLAAAQLWIEAEAMVLKRQGQRALRDFLTLEDCEVGDGAALDLEVGTRE